MSKPEYRWDLEHILGNNSIDDLISEYFIKLKNVAQLFTEDNVFSSKTKLLFFHKVSLECSQLSNRILNYLNNKCNEDLSNTEYFEKLQKLKCDMVIYHKKLSEFDNKAIAHKDLILSYLEDDDFKYMTRFYQGVFRGEQYKLSPEINKHMSTYAPMSQSYERIFSMLKDRNIPIKSFKSKKRKIIIIRNYEEYIKTQYSEDRIIRKNAYLNWHSAITQMQDTFASLLYFHILEQNIDAKNLGFEGGFYESQIFQDELTHSFIPYLYKKVSRFGIAKRKFDKTRKKLLKDVWGIKDGIKPWDLRMPIVKDEDLDEISIEEAKQLTIDSLSILGEEYIRNIKKAFDERWIDWEIRANKVTGAYSIACCSGVEKKYILMNYNYKLDSVYTLVHELGHSLHSVEFCKHQEIYDSTSIFIAEIPSSLNEIFLSFHLLEKYKNNAKKQLQIYDYLLHNFFGSTINQIILSDWEYSINTMVNNGRVLTAELAKSVYKNKQMVYQGNRITKPLASWKDISLVNVLTVPHFYSGDFYVYKYAVGAIVSLLIYLRIKQDPTYINKYFEFLRSGESKSNLDTLKILDINLEKTDVWALLRKTLSEWVSEYRNLAQQIE